MVGTARIPYSTANCCSWSILTLPILTRPSYSSASSSRMGARALHGGHHSPQKSTNTGVGDSSTSLAKFCCVKEIILGAAIKNHGLKFRRANLRCDLNRGSVQDRAIPDHGSVANC